MSKPITISFVGTAQIKEWLEHWSKEDDRSVSATLRQILEKEAGRRVKNPATIKKVRQQNT